MVAGIGVSAVVLMSGSELVSVSVFECVLSPFIRYRGGEKSKRKERAGER